MNIILLEIYFAFTHNLYAYFCFIQPIESIKEIILLQRIAYILLCLVCKEFLRGWSDVGIRDEEHHQKGDMETATLEMVGAGHFGHRTVELFGISIKRKKVEYSNRQIWKYIWTVFNSII